MGRVASVESIRCPILMPNARHQARRAAGARDERTLFAVAWMPWLGAEDGRDPVLTRLLHGPGASPSIPSTPSLAR